jgi:hypothetical protein
MHTALEKARKAAGIGSLKKNYPENPRERGCGFWAAFIGVVGNELARADDALMAAQKEAKELAIKNADLEQKVSESNLGRIANGVESLALSESWTPDKRDTVRKKLVG